jgi:C1A family cysteine protease
VTAHLPGLTLRINKTYGWIPDLPDKRDFDVAQIVKLSESVPAKVDLTAQCPKTVYDQGDLGSCTANAIAGAIEFDQIKQKLTEFTPSRLFIYYNERVIEGTVSTDAGAMIRDGIKSVNKQGAPHESIWPYKISKFRSKPSSKSYTDALLHQALSYGRVSQTRSTMQKTLAAGFPFVVGFAVYESFESNAVEKTGTVPMPDVNNEELLGGHAVLCVGYDNSTSRYILRNSWGPNWGNKGYFTLPYAYLEDNDLADDFWVIKLIET